jgi:dolichol-phosphate mannosyltransferase
LRKVLRVVEVGFILAAVTVVCGRGVSVVGPCFEEEGVLPLFVGRVGAVLDSLGAVSELVLVDDGWRERAWEVVEKAAVPDPPELLAEVVALMDEGVDVVCGQRCRRAGDGMLERATAALFYRVIAAA